MPGLSSVHFTAANGFKIVVVETLLQQEEVLAGKK
jgi:hypothetical protein